MRLFKIYRLFFFTVLTISNVFGDDFDYKNIPVQENGRIKPLDTFAENQLLAIYSKRTLRSSALPEDVKQNKLSAIDWLFDIMLHPNDADKYKVFNIRNPEIVGSLGLTWDANHLYNRRDVLIGLQHQLDYITKVQSIPEDDRSPFDQQMLHVYNNVIRFQELSFSFTCLLDIIQIKELTIAKSMGIEYGESVSYYTIMKNAQVLNPYIKNITTKKEDTWTDIDREVSRIIVELNKIDQDKFARVLKVIPPENISSEESWFSVWEFMDGREIGIKQEKILNSLSTFLNAKLYEKEPRIDNAMQEYKNALGLYNETINMKHVEIETWYNKVDVFIKSISLYIGAFFLLVISWMTKPILLRKIAFIALLMGFGFHFYGILLRIIIMQRPPISTLYESIIFVNLIGVICACFLEWSRKDGMGIFIGTICGTVLHFVGFGYANDGDTLGMLVAVLNSNFWLATHVTTITIGYGTSLFAGLIGHVYLLQIIRDPSNTQYIRTINANMFGATIFALFFTLFGTILGGIWADQSWGRFWGWDPKENGALLIVMWQIMMLHMRITGYVKPIGFALGMILNNIVVILAWFGVNLLGVGLHSYGFATGIARNIAIFICLELFIGFGMYFWATSKKNSITLKNS